MVVVVGGGVEGGNEAPKNNEAKSEDKRGAISVAGFMYCQHYPSLLRGIQLLCTSPFPSFLSGRGGSKGAEE